MTNKISWLKQLPVWKLFGLTVIMVALAVLASPIGGHEILAALGAMFVVGYVCGASVHFKPVVASGLVLALLVAGMPARAMMARPMLVPGTNAYQLVKVSATNAPGSVAYSTVVIPLQQPKPHPSGPQPNPDWIGCLIAVVIIIAAFGYIIYRLIEFCQQHFPPLTPPATPPSTNNPPATNFPAVFGLGLVPLDVQTVNPAMVGAQGFALTCTLGVSNVTLTANTVLNESNELGWNDWTNAMAQAGINPAASMGGQAQYASNGVPLPAGSFPYTVTLTNGALAFLEPGVPSRTVVFDRSEDLVNWTPVLTNIVSQSITHLEAMDADAPADGAFYRARFQP